MASKYFNGSTKLTKLNRHVCLKLQSCSFQSIWRVKTCCQGGEEMTLSR